MWSPKLTLLTCLRTLNEFVVSNGDGDGDGDDIKELGSLNSIGGDLTIYGLQKVKGGSDVARSANLEGKPNLRSLILWWGNSSEKENDEMVLEGLQPHPHLKSLCISGFGGGKLPTWMGFSSCLPNLVVLKLSYCGVVKQLPSLGELPLLRILSIEKMEGVRCLGKEFHATTKSKAAFPSLKELSLVYMGNLEEWVVEEEQQQQQQQLFLHLEKLEIRESPKLKVVPTRVFPSLTELSIFQITGGMTVSSMVTRNLTSLTKVRLCRVEGLQFLPQGLLLNNNSTLQYLTIDHCPIFEGFVIPKFEELTPPGPLHHLEYLNLESCPALTFLPDFRCFTSLRELTIRDCRTLTEWVEQQQQFPHLESLEIVGSYRLIVAVTFFPSLMELYVEGIRDIIFRPTVSRNLAFLVKIDINDVEELQFLPQGLLLNK